MLYLQKIVKGIGWRLLKCWYSFLFACKITYFLFTTEVQKRPYAYIIFLIRDEWLKLFLLVSRSSIIYFFEQFPRLFKQLFIWSSISTYGFLCLCFEKTVMRTSDSVQNGNLAWGQLSTYAFQLLNLLSTYNSFIKLSKIIDEPLFYSDLNMHFIKHWLNLLTFVINHENRDRDLNPRV